MMQKHKQNTLNKSNSRVNSATKRKQHVLNSKTK